jgi:hypothetical protein
MPPARHIRWFSGGAIGSVLLVAACMSDYQKGVDDPQYGGAVGLLRPDAGGSTGTAPPPTCATPVDAGPTCAVTFKQILESFRTAQCNTTAACHGGPAEPRIDPDNPAATYATFAGFVVKNANKPYINPCSTDPTQSAMACNLDPKAPCGVLMPQGGVFDDAKLKDIQTWLQCGSPNN